MHTQPLLRIVPFRPEQNDALAALQQVIDGSMPTIISTSNEQFSLRADRFAAEFGLTLIIKGSGNEYRRLPEIAATKRSLILPLAFRNRRMWRRRKPLRITLGINTALDIT